MMKKLAVLFVIALIAAPLVRVDGHHCDEVVTKCEEAVGNIFTHFSQALACVAQIVSANVPFLSQPATEAVCTSLVVLGIYNNTKTCMWNAICLELDSK